MFHFSDHAISLATCFPKGRNHIAVFMLFHTMSLSSSSIFSSLSHFYPLPPSLFPVFQQTRSLALPSQNKSEDRSRRITLIVPALKTLECEGGKGREKRVGDGAEKERKKERRESDENTGHPPRRIRELPTSPSIGPIILFAEFLQFVRPCSSLSAGIILFRITPNASSSICINQQC